jgi:hypothetical protein
MARQTGTDHDLLAMALVGYRGEKARIDATIAAIQANLGKASGAPAQSAPAKRTMSAAGRRHIAAAQRKRWAAVRKGHAQAKSMAPAKVAAPKKRKLSAAGRKAIIVATRKRWAAYRKAGGRKVKAVAKAATARA